MSIARIQNFITGDYLPLTHSEIQKISEKASEIARASSGRIHLHLEKNASLRVLDRASEIFEMLFLGEKEETPYVLIYVCKNNRQFALVCGPSLDHLLPPNAWTETIENMTIYFKNGDIGKAIMEGMESAEKVLTSKFPINI